MKRIAVYLVTAILVLAGCETRIEPSDERPDFPRTIAKMRVDEARCERYSKGKCKKWDDRDYVIVLQDGTEYDIDKKEYDSLSVGDAWPR